MSALARYRKAFAALAAGVAVFLASGLITGSTAVWISTAIAAVGTALGVTVAPKNAPNAKQPKDGGVAVVEVLLVVVLVVVLVLLFHGPIR